MKKLIPAILLSTPMLVFAQELGNVQRLLEAIGRLVRTALPIVIGLILLALFWGLAKFVFAAGNEEAKTEGKKLMIWGVVALFVAVTVWGLVNFIGGAVGVTPGSGAPNIPTVPGL